ncbi:unnamed protein product, partial [Mesorhabditis belari]|uniref:NADP-dependent oxidoreductase domain-containing protein n=1 Tax=Mesorhabditis belari TaxID=2138241 RepID=A0AAF3J833_9BILA
MLKIILILLFISSVRAQYDYRGRDYVRQKAERLIFGLAMVKDNDMYRIMDEALAAGYRTFDTAQMYGNEAAVGEALNTLLPKYRLNRQDVFVVSKVQPPNQGDRADPSIVESLRKLNLGYIDLMLIHWPNASPDNPRNPYHHRMERRKTWMALEKYYALGLLKAIGVSNFHPHHLDDLLSYARVFPAVDESESSLSYQTNDLLEYCARKGIFFWAYTCQLRHDQANLLNIVSKFTKIANKYKITPKMLEYIYALNRGMGVVMGASSPIHIKENRALLNYKLQPEDMTALTLPNGTTGRKSIACGNINLSSIL